MKLDLQRSFLISEIELYNWGPFGGLQRMQVDEGGTAIVGQTGSGKTTIVDAVTTLLTERPLYNLASTGGHESDRDLVSYVRGVTGSGNDTGDNSHVARKAGCLSGIGIHVRNGNAGYFLGGLLSIEGTGFAAADLKRLWVMDDTDQSSMTDWLERHQEGGTRAVRHHVRNTPGVYAFDSKRAFLARVRRAFDVGDNAFELLNRAAGLKQLNSIDDLFRDLVLDDRAMFGRAQEVIDAFDDLQSIHAELEVARQQQGSLQAVAVEHDLWCGHVRRCADLQEQKTVLPRWFAAEGIRVWSARVELLGADAERAAAGIAAEKNAQTVLQTRLDELHRSYIEAGGGDVESLRDRIEQREHRVAVVARTATDYRRLCAVHQWDETIDAAHVASNQASARAEQASLGDGLAEQVEELERLTAEAVVAERDTARLQEELAAAKAAPSSNIPPPYLAFKNELTAASGIDAGAVAFVAELIEVAPEQASWRGAIERALGGHRLRLVVPADAARTALRWVNGRDNRLHVRLLGEGDYAGDGRFMDDGYSRKLNFKPHPRRETVKRLVANIDRHCVADAETLRTTPHALAVTGLMSQQRGVYDKQDRRRLDEDWLTGFDNRDLLERLGRELATAGSKARAARAAVDALTRDRRAREQAITQLEQFLALRFEDIDASAIEQELETMRARLAALLDPTSDTAAAEQRWQTAREALEARQQLLLKQTRDEQRLRDLLEAAEQRVREAEARLGPALTEAELGTGNAAFAAPALDQFEQLTALERAALEEVQEALDAASGKRTGAEAELVRLMERAQKTDTGSLTETGTDLRDVPDYLERLRVLTEEALPDKQIRFLAYLNKSSDEGVTQLLRSIDGEVYHIEERIDDINHTMRRVDFMPHRYLRLEPAKISHERIRALQQAQRRLQGASLTDDEGESHYRALTEVIGILKEAVDNPRRLAARALLDPRYRLSFSVSVIERDGDRVIENRTGSQGGSGGEKEIIASYVLTASLSYALSPDGAARPLFGTVILDEAFSKSSMTVAARIVAALREFGLHPLFVTPNKEMRLLRAHTRSAIVVHRTGNQSVSTSLSWEELDEKAGQRPAPGLHA